MLRSLLILCATSLLLSACLSTRQTTATGVRVSANVDSLLLPPDSPSEAYIQGLQVNMQPQNLDAQRDVASRAEAASDRTKFAIYFSGAVILAALVFLLLTGSF